MATGETAVDDDQAIKVVIQRQFESLSWTRESTGDWSTFEADFFPGAALYPAARPAKRQSVAEFVGRMRELASTKLQSFDETVLGIDVQVFGNIAMAAAAGEIVENGETKTRAVEMLLLVKSEGALKIVAQAWDTEQQNLPLPKRLTR